MEECQDCPHEKSAQRVQLPDGRRVRALACHECPWLTENRPPPEPFSLRGFLEGIAPADPALVYAEPEPETETETEFFGDSDADSEPPPAPESFPSASDRTTAIWRAFCLAPFGCLLAVLHWDGWVALAGFVVYGALGALSGLLGPSCERHRSQKTLAWGVGLACAGGVVAAGLVLSVLQLRGFSWPAWTELGASNAALRVAVWSVAAGLVIGSGLIGGELALRRQDGDSDFLEQLTVFSLAGITWALCTLLTLDLAQGARCGVASWGVAYVASQWWPSLSRKIQAFAHWRNPDVGALRVWWIDAPEAETSYGDDTMSSWLAPSEIAARLTARCLVVGLAWLCVVLALQRGTARAISQGSSLALLIGVSSLAELWLAGRVTRLWRLASLTAIATWLAIACALLNSHYLFGTWSGGLLAGVEELSTAIEPGAWGRSLLPATLIWGPLWITATARASGGMDPKELVALALVHLVAWIAVLHWVRGQGYLAGLLIFGISEILLAGVLLWIYEFADQATLRVRASWSESLDADL